MQRRVARCVGQTSYEIARGNLAEETAGKIAERLKNNSDVCLDIYHAAEHISDCGKVLFGGTAEQKEGLERMRNVLLPEGLSGMERELSLLKVGLKEWQVKSMGSLLEYFRGNAGRLNYCGRLASGRAIGSGLIAGACKSLVGLCS